MTDTSAPLTVPVISGVSIVQAAMPYAGYDYVLGAKGANHSIDCSGLVYQACRAVGIICPHGTVNQFPWSIPTSRERAIATPGALLFTWAGPANGGGRGNHVAISRGDGTTIEARSSHTTPEVGVFQVGKRFTHGRLIPGVTYPAFESADQPLPPLTTPSSLPPAPLPPPVLPLLGADDTMQFVKGTYPTLDGTGGFNLYHVYYDPATQQFRRRKVDGPEWRAMGEPAHLIAGSIDDNLVTALPIG